MCEFDNGFKMSKSPIFSSTAYSGIERLLDGLIKFNLWEE